MLNKFLETGINDNQYGFRTGSDAHTANSDRFSLDLSPTNKIQTYLTDVVLLTAFTSMCWSDYLQNS